MEEFKNSFCFLGLEKYGPLRSIMLYCMQGVMVNFELFLAKHLVGSSTSHLARLIGVDVVDLAM